MKSIVFDLEATTPVFMSGADQSRCEFRAQSIKGLLRFWYRALFPDSLKEESVLWGSTEDRSPVEVIVRSIDRPVEDLASYPSWNRGHAPYLAYGLKWQQKGEWGKVFYRDRSAFNYGKRFSLTMKFRRLLSRTQQTRILLSLQALLLLGGVGGRSRRGLGSLRVLPEQPGERNPESVPTLCFTSRDQYVASLKGLLNQVGLSPETKPDHTALSSQSRIIVSQEFANAKVALQSINSLFLNFRTFKKNNPSERNFESDHDIVLAFLYDTNFKARSRNTPERCAFGLPHNYFYMNSVYSLRLTQNSIKKWSNRFCNDAEPLLKSLQASKAKGKIYHPSFGPNGINKPDPHFFKAISQEMKGFEHFKGKIKKMCKVGYKINIDPVDTEGEVGRRASPLILHVQGLDTAGERPPRACVVSTFLPAPLLPPGWQLRYGQQHGPKVNVDLPDDFSAVTKFIDYLENEHSWESVL